MEELIQIEPGIYYDVPFEEYKKWDCFNKSSALSVLRTINHYVYELEHPKNSDSMSFGSLVDCLLLEPNTFEDTYSILPDTYTSVVRKVKVEKPWSKNANFCKAWEAEQKDFGFICISYKDFEKAQQIVNNIKNHRTASKMLEGKYQVSIVYIDQYNGVKCKVRYDVLSDHFEYKITDLKCTEDARDDSLSRTIYNFGYDIQAAMYQNAWLYHKNEVVPFCFIFAETTHNFNICTKDADENMIAIGNIRARNAMKKYKEYKDTNLTYGYSEFLEPVSVPDWAVKRILENGVGYDIEEGMENADGQPS